MKKLLFTLSLFVACLSLQAQTNHPWQGKKVGYIGDSITDPNCLADVRKYWSFLQEWLDITPYVYGISGREWNDVPRQVEQLNKEHGQDVDAILVFLGTNDFNSGLPIGEWYEENDVQVWAATGKPKELVTRKHRTPVFSNDTFKGRINIGIQRMKQLYPDKQIILLTPIHRAYATFGNSCRKGHACRTDLSYQPHRSQGRSFGRQFGLPGSHQRADCIRMHLYLSRCQAPADGRALR